MKSLNVRTYLAALIMVTAAYAAPQAAKAHCDGLDGPVVSAARVALKENNVNLVLIWVQKDDDEVIRELRKLERTLSAFAAECTVTCCGGSSASCNLFADMRKGVEA